MNNHCSATYNVCKCKLSSNGYNTFSFYRAVLDREVSILMLMSPVSCLVSILNIHHASKMKLPREGKTIKEPE